VVPDSLVLREIEETPVLQVCLVHLAKPLEELVHRARWVHLENLAALAVLAAPADLEHLDSQVPKESHVAAAHLASPDPREIVDSPARLVRL